MTELAKGGNTLVSAHGEVSGLLLGVTWDSGPLVCDVSAMICGPERKVLTDEHFLFFNNLVAPDRRVFLREQPETPDGRRDRAQLMVDLADLPGEVDRVIVTLSTLTEGASLSALRSLRIRAVDAATGAEKAAYAMGQELTVETCLVIAEIYRNQGNWKFRAIGQGYMNGLSGLSSDFGVNLA